MVEHDARLDMLGCLDRKPQTIRQVSERIGKAERHVAHHMKMLVAFELAKETAEEG
jgi:DNA-binding transcriptional ArsR family regulator